MSERVDNVVWEGFPDIYHFMRTIDNRPKSSTCPGDSSRTGDDDFCGGLSWEGAKDALSHGLPETCTALNSELKKFRETGAANIGVKSKPRNYYYGSKPNVAAAIQGRPKSMRQRQREAVKVKTVRLIYDQCQNAGTRAETLHKSGLTVLCLVYALEKAGYRVKFDLMPFASTYNGELAISILNLKEYGQPLDILKLSFPITHPSMFRRFGFRWLETVDGLRYTYGGYGKHIDRKSMLTALEKIKQFDNGYLIQIDDCEAANFDVKTLAKNLNISL